MRLHRRRRPLFFADLFVEAHASPASDKYPPVRSLAPVLIAALRICRPRDHALRRFGGEHLSADRAHARGGEVRGVRVRAEDELTSRNSPALGHRAAVADAEHGRVLVDARARGEGGLREAAHPLHWMQLAIVGIRRAPLVRTRRDANALSGKDPRALLDLGPLLFISRDLIGAVPLQLAVDA